MSTATSGNRPRGMSRPLEAAPSTFVTEAGRDSSSRVGGFTSDCRTRSTHRASHPAATNLDACRTQPLDLLGCRWVRSVSRWRTRLGKRQWQGRSGATPASRGRRIGETRVEGCRPSPAFASGRWPCHHPRSHGRVGLRCCQTWGPECLLTADAGHPDSDAFARRGIIFHDRCQ